MARTWAEVQALGLTALEQALVAACREGEDCVLGDGTRPAGPDPARTVRAEVLRFLILGGDADCPAHARGVMLAGAFVSGTLDLSFARADRPVALDRCRFAERPTFRQSRLASLSLEGSAVPGLDAQGVEVLGVLHLGNGFTAQGEVRLSAARIGIQLVCTKGTFEARQNDKGQWTKALNADGMQLAGSVYLDDGFNATGEVSLMGADIGGQLTCEGGTCAAVRNDECKSADATPRNGANKQEDDALNGQSMRVAEGFLFRGVSIKSGRLDLASATVYDLVDDLESWPEAGRLRLDGFSYQRFTKTFTDSHQRLKWLARGTVWNGAFHPQPYAQLAKVLRAMGHDGAARDVLVEQGRLIALHDWQRAYRALNGDWGPAPRSILADLRQAFAQLSRLVVGYGYQPFRSLWWLAALWALAAILAHLAWVSGAMVPNSGVILTSAGWLDLAGRPDAAQVWAAGAGADWETFSALGWGLDLVVPILDLGQVAAWAPSTARGPWGTGLWWGRWLLIGAGWVVAGLAAAAVTGIIRRA